MHTGICAPEKLSKSHSPHSKNLCTGLQYDLKPCGERLRGWENVFHILVSSEGLAECNGVTDLSTSLRQKHQIKQSQHTKNHSLIKRACFTIIFGNGL